MKIICICKNYALHAKELNFEVPKKPIFFMKPDSSLLTQNKPFFYPSFSKNIHHEIEIVLKICKLGKNIQEKFAHTYYNEIGLGIDFTARDLQFEAMKAGYPWEIAKAFDNAAVISKFIPKSEFDDLKNITFSLNINGKQIQIGNTKDLVFYFDELIAYVSQFVTLKIGDLIYTGTPHGVGPIQINDHLEGYIADKKLLDFRIK
jgi:2-keto-4-pentenoate hydratase/2-oxohepta-3-ene-1,7-dioic acid hydratase in catechol pathway